MDKESNSILNNNKLEIIISPDHKDSIRKETLFQQIFTLARSFGKIEDLNYINYINALTNNYYSEVIDQDFRKYTNKNNKEDFYYTFKEIKMTSEEYQRYLDKVEVNKKLNKNLKIKNKEKALKI